MNSFLSRLLMAFTNRMQGPPMEAGEYEFRGSLFLLPEDCGGPFVYDEWKMFVTERSCLGNLKVRLPNDIQLLPLDWFHGEWRKVG